MSAEIGARNFGDMKRYNLLPIYTSLGHNPQCPLADLVHSQLGR
ncbi:MAG: nitric oxide synthase oxygenase [Brasilonema angustatum HA4187-MV1]|nr:nitric oxide synthase oxygenase [Brasilonema angustatum HA4187-MV1]